MAENKKSFIAYSDWNEIFKKLTDDEAGKLSKMIFAYVSDENPEAPDRITELIFEPIKQHLKRDLEKYENIKTKRSEAGKKGGLKSGETRSNQNQNEANEAIASKTQANEAVNDNGNVNDNDNVILLKKETKETEVLISEIEPDKIQEEIPSKKVALKKVSFKPPDPQEVQKYCDERQNGLNGQEFCDFYESKGWLIGKNKMKDWQAAVRTWEKYRKNENGRTNNGYNPNGKNGNSKVSGTQNLIDGLEYFEFT